jgi:predicted transglutaminase-like cysteine proteinase
MGRALGRTLPCARIPNASRLVSRGLAKLRGAALFGLILLPLCPAAAPAQTLAALPSPTRTLAVTGRADPIRAWYELCRETPGECGVNVTENPVVALTPPVWQLLAQVNREINDRIIAVADRDHWGVEDRWNLPEDGSGDCEDIQLLKRRILIERGLPRRAMRMTVVIDEEGGGHAVMMVRTDRGDLILDNRRTSVLPWTQTGYIYIKAEGQDGMDWISFGGATSPSAVANNDDPAPSVSSARIASR